MGPGYSRASSKTRTPAKGPGRFAGAGASAGSAFGEAGRGAGFHVASNFLKLLMNRITSGMLLTCSLPVM